LANNKGNEKVSTVVAHSGSTRGFRGFTLSPRHLPR